MLDCDLSPPVYASLNLHVGVACELRRFTVLASYGHDDAGRLALRLTEPKKKADRVLLLYSLGAHTGLGLDCVAGVLVSDEHTWLH